MCIDLAQRQTYDADVDGISSQDEEGEEEESRSQASMALSASRTRRLIEEQSSVKSKTDGRQSSLMKLLYDEDKGGDCPDQYLEMGT